jgi:hypothetical protein
MKKFYYILTTLNAFDDSYLPLKSWPHKRHKTRQEARNAKQEDIYSKYSKRSKIFQVDAVTFKPIKIVR